MKVLAWAATFCVASVVALALPGTPAADDSTIVLRSDLNHGAWAHGPDLPEARQDAAAAVLNGRIYVIGGYGPKSAQENTTLVLEPHLTTETPRPEEQGGPIITHVGEWTYAEPIPEAVDHAGAAALGGYIYVAGGRIEKLVTNKFWRYDPIDDTWTELESMPIPRYGPAVQGINGKIYVLGGTAAHGNDEKSIEVYDVATHAWKLLFDALGTEREDAASVIMGDKIAIVGGHTRGQQDEPYCDLFDPVHEKLRSCTNLRHARSRFGVATIDNRLVAIGGEDDPFGPLPLGVDMNDPFEVSTFGSSNAFSGRVGLPSGAISSGTASALGQVVRVAHGQTMEISETDAQAWVEGPWMPAPRNAMAVVSVGRVIWVIGGTYHSGTSPTVSVLRYVSPLIKVKLGGREH